MNLPQETKEFGKTNLIFLKESKTCQELSLYKQFISVMKLVGDITTESGTNILISKYYFQNSLFIRAKGTIRIDIMTLVRLMLS